MDLYTRASEAAQFLRDKGALNVEVAVMLGSGLGGFAETLAASISVPYSSIPHFPRTGVSGIEARRLSEWSVRTHSRFSGTNALLRRLPDGHGHVSDSCRKLLRVPTLLITSAAGS